MHAQQRVLVMLSMYITPMSPGGSQTWCAGNGNLITPFIMVQHC